MLVNFIYPWILKREVADFSHGQFYRIAVVNWSKELFFLGRLEDITGEEGNWRNNAQ